MIKQNKLLETYIHKYILNDTPISESQYIAYFRYLLLFLSLIALAAGVPWLQAAKSAGQGNIFLSYAIPIFVIVSAGITTSWVFISLSQKLKPVPNEDYLLRAKSPIMAKIGKHLIIHFLGMLASLPIIYISINFTKNIINVPFATAVAYGFTTLGVYNLYELFLVVVRKTKLKLGANELDHVKVNYSDILSNKVMPWLGSRKHIYEQGPFFMVSKNDKENPVDIAAAYDDVNEFHIKIQFIDNNNANNINSVFKGFLNISAISVALCISVLNFMSRFTIAYKATNSIGLNRHLCAITAAVSTMPYFGLDLVWIYEVFYISIISMMVCYTYQRNSFISDRYTMISKLIPIIAIGVSSFSGRTDAYVIETEVNASILHNLTSTLGFSMWLSRIFIEGSSVYNVMNGAIKLIERKKYHAFDQNMIELEKIERLSQLALECNSQDFQEFADKYKNNLPRLSEAETNISISYIKRYLFCCRTTARRSSVDEKTRLIVSDDIDLKNRSLNSSVTVFASH